MNSLVDLLASPYIANAVRVLGRLARSKICAGDSLDELLLLLATRVDRRLGLFLLTAPAHGQRYSTAEYS